MGIKRKIKHAIKKKKEKEIAFKAYGYPVIKREEYVCNTDEEGYGPDRYLWCPKESKIKTTVYVTSMTQVYDDIRVRYTIYAYPVISRKKEKWSYYIHESGEGELGDCNGIENGDKLLNTPKEAIERALHMILSLQSFG